jgi:ankyrin repeat protein
LFANEFHELLYAKESRYVSIVSERDRIEEQSETRAITLLTLACCQKDEKNESSLKIVELLLNDNKVDVNVDVEQDLSRTVLYYVCSCGKVESARLLLSRNDIDVNKVNNNGYGPLYIAC